MQYFRHEVTYDHKGVQRILKFLNDLVSHAKDRGQNPQASSGGSEVEHPLLTAGEVEVINQALKLLFNLTLSAQDEDGVLDEEAESRLSEAADSMQTLLTISTADEKSRIELHS